VAEIAEDDEPVGAFVLKEVQEPLSARRAVARQFDAALVTEPSLDSGVVVTDDESALHAEVDGCRRGVGDRLDSRSGAASHQIAFSVPSAGS
jgi:hypothetical protein